MIACIEYGNWWQQSPLMKKDLFILNPWANRTGNNQGAKTDNYWLTNKTICSGTHFHISKEIIFLSSPTRVNWYWQDDSRWEGAGWPVLASLPYVLHHPLHPVPHPLPWRGTTRLDLPYTVLEKGIKVFNKNWRGGGWCWKYLYSVKCHPLRYLGRCGGSDQVLQVRDHKSRTQQIIANDKQTDEALYVKDQHSSATQPACWRTPGLAPPSTSPHTRVPEEKIFRWHQRWGESHLQLLLCFIKALGVWRVDHID